MIRSWDRVWEGVDISVRSFNVKPSDPRSTWVITIVGVAFTGHKLAFQLHGSLLECVDPFALVSQAPSSRCRARR
jgi:hypothetical protein